MSTDTNTVKLIPVWVQLQREADTLIWVITITPVFTCSNAVVGLVRRDMVDAVVFPWQHHVPVLEQRDPAREAEIRVAPLMNLIGQRHENGQGKDVAVPRIRRRQGLWNDGTRQTERKRKAEKS